MFYKLANANFTNVCIWRAGHATIFKLRDNDDATQQDKIWKILRSRCLNGEATTNFVIMQKPITLWPENMVTLSRQCCRGPSSFFFVLGITDFFFPGLKVVVLQEHWTMLVGILTIFSNGEPMCTYGCIQSALTIWNCKIKLKYLSCWKSFSSP